MIGITMVLALMECSLCDWHDAYCVPGTMTTVLNHQLCNPSSGSPDVDCLITEGETEARGVSHSLKLRLMNGTQACLAPGLECGFLGLGVVMCLAIVASLCTPSYLRAAVIQGSVIASWDWWFSCCLHCFPGQKPSEDGSQCQPGSLQH